MILGNFNSVLCTFVTVMMAKLTKRVSSELLLRVFDEWLGLTILGNQSNAPPEKLPPHLKNKFLMNGYNRLVEAYQDDRSKPELRQWGQLSTWLSLNESQLEALSTYGKYGSKFKGRKLVREHSSSVLYCSSFLPQLD
ncbi:hypothetical protein KIN20_030540 [Parelaphostrongylus tenuis]|uniref:Uncharacterized protein n=1 Tax=Parelaphostrongylus tenuis TaxID=148309 RepID=A0AAD5R472_PARTN|nr:hypothetical protein KIN20_030540 [Parelaphostrongylus tenuis]